MAKQRATFEEGAVKNGVDGELAMKIFDLVEKFAGYGFNKSHSAAYALVSYQTLWLKTHYPAEFMAAVMTADMDNTEKSSWSGGRMLPHETHRVAARHQLRFIPFQR